MAFRRECSPNKISRSKQPSLIVLTNLSACAFKFELRVGNFTDSIPASASMLRNSRVQRISVMDQIAFSQEEPIHGIRQIAGDLTHPQSIRSARNSTDLHLSSRNIHEEEHDESRQAGTSPDLHTKEIRSDNLIPMVIQGLLPRHSSDSFGAGSMPCRLRILATVFLATV